MTREPLTWESVQPAYAAYCIAHLAENPQEMLERDTAAYTGGKMCGFLAWMTSRGSAWRKAAGKREGDLLSDAERAEFHEWLVVEALRSIKPAGPRFRFIDGATEITSGPSLMRDDPRGGDPHVVAEVSRLHRPEALYDLCALANAALVFEGLAPSP